MKCNTAFISSLFLSFIGVMNGPLKFLTARKILPLLDLLAKFKRVLACSCSPNFCVARKLAKQIFYFCSCSQKNRSARHARKDHSSPLFIYAIFIFQISFNHYFNGFCFHSIILHVSNCYVSLVRP